MESRSIFFCDYCDRPNGGGVIVQASSGLTVMAGFGHGAGDERGKFYSGRVRRLDHFTLPAVGDGLRCCKRK